MGPVARPRIRARSLVDAYENHAPGRPLSAGAACRGGIEGMTVSASGRRFVHDGPEAAEQLHRVDEVVEVDRLDDVGVHAAGRSCARGPALRATRSGPRPESTCSCSLLFTCRSTSRPSTFGIFRSSSMSAGLPPVAIRIRVAPPQVIERFGAVARHRHLVQHAIGLAAPPASARRRSRCPQPAGCVAVRVIRRRPPLFVRQREVERRAAIDAPSAQVRPPWRWTMRRTFARPMPVPSNSSSLCSRWKTPNSLCGVLHVEADAVVAHEDHRLVGAPA